MTYFGHYEAWFEQLTMVVFFNHCFYVFLAFYVGLFNYADGFVSDMQGQINELNLKLNADSDQNNVVKLPAGEIDRIFIDLFELHKDFLR